MVGTKTDFTLSSGRDIHLTSIDQWEVYSGLLEGLPFRRLNDETVARIADACRVKDGREPYVIAPIQRPIEYRGNYPFGEPARLPSIACVARFRSNSPARDDEEFYSMLTVVWFQDEFAFPIDGDAEKAIRAVDWGKLAADYGD